MLPLIRALVAECREDEYVIARSPFRWLKIKVGEGFETIERQRSGHGYVMPNCYESISLAEVCEMYGLEARYAFEHAAIVRGK
jgi:hypothetical protein